VSDSSRLDRTLWTVVAAATLTVMAGAILGPIVPAIQDELGVSGTAAGLIITTHGGVIVLASPLMGALVDRFGPRRPFIAGLFVYGIGGGAGLFVDSFGPLLASRVVLGLGTAAVYTAVTVLIYELYEGAAMDRALGYRSSANSAGAAFWPLIGGAAGTMAWNLPFGVYLVAIPLGAVAVATIPDTRAGDDPEREAESESATLRERVAGTLAVFRDRPTLPAVYLLYFGTNALLYAVVVFYPQLLATVDVTSSFAISLYLAANGAAGGVSAALYGRLITRTDRRTLVGIAFLLWVLGFGAATLVTGPVGAVLPVVLFGLGVGLTFPSAFAWIEAFAPSDRQGQFSSYLASAGYTGQFLSPILFGPLIPLIGVRGVFGVAAVVAGTSAVALAIGTVRRRDGTA